MKSAVHCWFAHIAIAFATFSGGYAETASPPPISLLYVVTNPDGPNAVEAFQRDPVTGMLTRIGRFMTQGSGDPFVGGFEQHSIVSNGTFVYAVNPGSDEISAFAIKQNGRLRLIGNVASGGRRPVSLALSGGLLYVANEGNSPVDPNLIAGNYTGFRIRGDGSLLAIQNSTVILNPGDSPADVVFSANGKVLIGNRLPGNRIDSFAVSSSGLLINHRVTFGGGGPFGALFNPAKPWQLAVTLAVPEFFPGQSAPGIAYYEVQRDGTIGILDTYADPDTSDAGLRDPCWLAFTPDGKYFWSSSFIPRMLSAFSVSNKGYISRLSDFNPQDSEDVPDPSNPGMTTNVIVGSTDIAVEPSGRFLYQLRAFSVPDGAVPVNPRIEVLSITGKWEINGGLAPVQSVPLPADLAETGVMGLVLVDR